MTNKELTAPARLRRLAADLLAVLLAALAFLWPALVNGRPPVFADTAYYFTLGDYAVRMAGLVRPANSAIAPGDPTRLTHEADGTPTPAYTLMAARSPAYAVFLFATQRLGGLWLTAVLQALAVAWSLLQLCRALLPRRALVAFAAASALCAVFSPLPFFAPFIMPDVFGGVAAACAIALLVGGAEQSRAAQVGLIALLLFALTLHGSHPLLIAALGGVGGLTLWGLKAGWRAALSRSAMLIGLAAVGVAADAAAFAWLGSAGHEPLTRPPFLTARLLADGPGRDYLTQACDANPNAWVICPDADKELDNSEFILWRDEPWLGVFSPAPILRRRAMSAQDGAFARAVLLHDPAGVAWTALKNWGLQLIRPFVDDPLTNQGFWMQHRYWRRTSLEAISVSPDPCLAYVGCVSKVPIKPLRRFHLWTAGLAAAWLALRLLAEAGRLVGRRHRPIWSEARTRLFAAVALAGMAVAINAAVCGMISGPFPRYQARIIWLLPAMIAALEVGLWRGMGPVRGFASRAARLDLTGRRRKTPRPA